MPARTTFLLNSIVTIILLFFLKDKCNIYFRFSLAKELAIKLKDLINVCCQNLLYAYKLQNWAHDKGVKPRSYVSDEKV